MDNQNHANIKIYEKSRQYLFASWLMAVGRFSLITFIMFAILGDNRFGLPHNVIHTLFRLSGSIWVVTILLSVGLTIPLRCSNCGKRIAVITSQAKVSPDYIAREQSESTKKKFINFFIPLELFTKRMRCVRCNQEYSLKQ